ncbi:hypothetical protein BI364_16580 [Acidihalobacter yilgarnensis]|uniref:Transcriptional regulator n=1 Tax=Acidihalobacter yilgarnensis TaxID=2819280 RepID=A0A1D8IS69_9GAMM|nr:FMN-binding negative transcriptional regulator [Acidihalobacter yilgarnensis]AOU99329.1 hypothetical protein BI364_16580 [Acidihalobacter yilgarnensis]
MYIPPAFEEGDAARIEALLRAYPLALLIGGGDGGPLLTHVPLLHEPDGGPQGRLIGHLARANQQADALADGDAVVAVFQGPDAYISPSWYVTPGVPTWNYAAVHVHGRVRRVADREVLSALVGRLTARFEADVGADWVWGGPDSPHGRLLDHIVGFEIHIERIEAKFKLGQNRSREDREGAMAKLAASTRAADVVTAQLMATDL